MDVSATSRTSDLFAESLGWPYWYSKGSPSTPWESGPEGVDCSGYAQMALVAMGLLSPSYKDRGADTLADDSDPIEVGQQQIGDLAYYSGHVMVVASLPDGTGHSQVIGASGGTRTTLGNDADARVKLFTSALYRGSDPNNGGFVCYMRLKADKR